ncbi:MAG: ribosome maturation factor RimM [Thermodesulfovibrionales bacterium]
MKSPNELHASATPYRILGRILREQGLKGEVKVLPVSRLFFSLHPGDTVYPLSGEAALNPLVIRSIRDADRHAFCAFEGINDRAAAALLRGSDLGVDRSRLPVLPEGEYYYDQIIGLEVTATDGGTLGRVVEIFETGSNDVYVVQGLRRQYLIPAIRDVIVRIDPGAGVIVIRPMEGLLD